MSEVLSQEEIDQLLQAINAGDPDDPRYTSIENFEKYLTERKYSSEKPYGIFDTDVTICRFFNNGKNENVLQDIKLKNEQQGMGNIKIPNTNITLINYSYCPRCNTAYSYKEINAYYKNPKYSNFFKNRAYQLRTDTRVCCNNCDTYFLPSLIIEDGTPKNEVQYLCRLQIINAVEIYFSKKNIQVFTKKKSNILNNNGLKAIKNDVLLKDLEETPTLITNLIQYTPYNCIPNLIDGSNILKGDILFNEWRKSDVFL